MSEGRPPITVAVQHGLAPGPEAGKAAAIEQLRLLAPAARRRGAQLLLLPQLYLGGRPDNPDAARAAAELSDGPSVRAVCAIAGEVGIGLACGYVELCTGELYDSTLFIDARGHAIANYRRVHLLPGCDRPIFARGQWLTLVPFAGRRLGLLAGVDIDGPEQARALALAGADLLLVAGGHDADGHGTDGHGAGAAVAALLPARAVENGCALAFANAATGSAAPASCLIGPDGRVLAATGGGLAVATLAAGGRAGLALVRRPRLYARLVAPMPDEDGPRL